MNANAFFIKSGTTCGLMIPGGNGKLNALKSANKSSIGKGILGKGIGGICGTVKPKFGTGGKLNCDESSG